MRTDELEHTYDYLYLEMRRDEERTEARRQRLRWGAILALCGIALCTWQVIAPFYSTLIVPLGTVLFMWGWALWR